MRRKDREVTDINEILDIISRCDVVRLGLNDEAVPYIVPLNFAYKMVDGKLEIYMHSARVGHKVDLIDKDCRCFFEMDCDHLIVSDAKVAFCTTQYSSVMGSGTIEKVTDEKAKKECLQMLLDRYHPGEKFPLGMSSIPGTLVLKLKVETLSAKSNVGKIHIPSNSL